ncbi:hypothetical protein [Acidimangrovimonas sediminis]|uniref:hypothetical protein n=1 Tax=Acidimangrovimonas sediminis TaxID=2056283 RepID=UPI001304BCE8|nr:hypothetical protein [Acidimangrovimonas sediminis]
MKIAVYKIVFLVVYIGAALAVLRSVGWIDWSARFYAVVLIVGMSAGIFMRALFGRIEE